MTPEETQETQRVEPEDKGLVVPAEVSFEVTDLEELKTMVVLNGLDSRAKRWPHVLNWLPRYDWGNDFVYDCAAGLTVGVMAIPQSLSYALIAGLPPQYGLYSDLQICYPIFGTSNYLVVGPVAVMSLMSRFAMEKIDLREGSDEWVNMVCFLSVLVCFVQFFIWILRLGSRISSFLPESAVAGFSSAAALIIGSTQLPALFGLPKCKTSSGQSCDFVSTIWYSASNLGRANVASLICGFCSMLILVLFKFIRPGSARPDSRKGIVLNLIPKLGALTVVVLSVSFFYATYDEGRKTTVGKVDVVGYIPDGLPSPRWFPAVPRDSGMALSLFLSSIPIALVGFAEATAIAKASAKLRGGDPRAISEDDEVLALAFCNGFTAWVGGYPVTGSFSRTAINAESGARSPLSTGIAAVAVVFVLLVFTPYLALLPKAAVSAIVLTAVVKLVDVHEFQRLYKLRKNDRNEFGLYIFTAVFFGSLVLGVETGLVIGVAMHQALELTKKSR